jgi:hypothetical protein
MTDFSKINIDTALRLVKDLETFDKNKAIREGLSKGAKTVSKYGKGLLRIRMKNPHGVTGNLLSSFRERVKRNKLGALVGFYYPTGNHSHLVDGGTKDRGRTGIMPGNFFWSDARFFSERKVFDEVYEGVRKAVERINKRR